MHWWLGYSPHKPDCHLSYKKWQSGLKKKRVQRSGCDYFWSAQNDTHCAHKMITWQNQLFDKIETGLWFRTLEFRGELLLQIWYIKSENLIRSLDSRTQLICQQNTYLLLNSTNTLYKKKLGTAAKGGECRL